MAKKAWNSGIGPWVCVFLLLLSVYVMLVDTRIPEKVVAGL